MTVHESKRSLWNRDFVLMILGRLVSNTGSQIHRVVLITFVLYMYGSRVYGITMTLTALPSIIFVILGGVICDRYSKARIMAITDLFSGLVFALLAVYLAFDKLDVSVLYVLVFCGAAAGALFTPASASIVPSLVSRSDIGRATSVISASDSIVSLPACLCC